ncbi:MAG: dienelactone hydrolase family protein [Actinobacteria bacterium]|nr:dienelactone hydrolase family protein [Actinomycetota bacterium]
MSDSFVARTVHFDAGGDSIEGYAALVEDSEPRGGVVVLHHLPGYDAWSKQVVRTLGAMGYNAVCPNLYSRDAPGAAPDDAAALVRSRGGVPDSRILTDAEGAAGYLRGQANSNGKVGVIGYCSGGRQSALVACNLDVDAAVDCYGAYVTGTVPDGWLLKITNLTDQLPNLRCPLLGLFGNEDKTPSPEHVDELDAVLSANNKQFEIHRYDGAGHGFFTTDRPSYRVEAAVDGWEKISDFFAKNLGVMGGCARTPR